MSIILLGFKSKIIWYVSTIFTALIRASPKSSTTPTPLQRTFSPPPTTDSPSKVCLAICFCFRALGHITSSSGHGQVEALTKGIALQTWRRLLATGSRSLQASPPMHMTVTTSPPLARERFPFYEKALSTGVKSRASCRITLHLALSPCQSLRPVVSRF